MRKWRWAVVLASGLALVVAKRLVDWPEPLLPNVLLYITVPLLIAALRDLELRDVGLAMPTGRGRWTIVGALVAGAVVVAVVGTRSSAMMGYYPVEHWGPVSSSPGPFLAYQMAIAVIMVATELMYRGWLVLAVAERIGTWAVVVSAVPYALAHLGKPVEEAAFSLVAGLVFGWADLRARSVLPSLAGHMTGSALFDYLALTW